MSQKKEVKRKKQKDELKNEKKSILIGGSVAVLFFALIGSVFLIILLVTNNRIKDSQDWPYTTGRITFVFFTKREYHMSRDIGKRPDYRPYVEYRYSVAGKNYINDKIFIHTENMKADEADAILKQFPLKSEVKVYYKAEDPSNSVLIRSSSGKLTGLIVASSIFFGISLLIMTGAIAGYLNLVNKARKKRSS